MSPIAHDIYLFSSYKYVDATQNTKEKKVAHKNHLFKLLRLNKNKFENGLTKAITRENFARARDEKLKAKNEETIDVISNGLIVGKNLHFKNKETKTQ